jgi:hypothetical protein
MKAPAYINWGRFVCDCPRWPDCTTSLEVTPGQDSAQCPPAPAGCGLTYTITWPRNGPAIMAALGRRPVPATRNWYPAAHPRALAHHLPAGETAADLDAETAAHMALET